MRNDDAYISLFWALIWLSAFVMGIVGIFWNAAQIAVAVLSAIMFSVFFAQYIKIKKQ